MEAKSDGDGVSGYTTPYRVQAYFLGKSRANWKAKYQELRRDFKRLENRVRDVTKSREMWRERAESPQSPPGSHAAADADEAAAPTRGGALKKG
jgi:hypothetical protein